MFDPVSQKAFLVDDSHIRQRTSNRVGKKCLAQASQGRRIVSPKKEGRDRQIKLIDQILFEKRSE